MRGAALLSVLLLAPAVAALLGRADPPNPQRRTAALSGLAGLVATVQPTVLPHNAAAETNTAMPVSKAAAEPQEWLAFASAETYTVVTDATKTMQPSVRPTPPAEIAYELGASAKRAIFLGEHHDAPADHLLQASLIRELHRKRPKMAVGLEAVQSRFQPALDAYIAGEISAAELEAAVEWRKRWFWPFAGYLPVFQACRDLRIPLLALNVDSEDLSMVETGGLPALPESTLRRYVPDGLGFSRFASTTAFKEYVAYIVKPSYTMHERMGILRTTITGQQLETPMAFRNFFSGRILWDEAMASASASWCSANPDGLLVGLVGSDHVKFGCGVPARTARMLPGGLSSVASVMLNPTSADTVSDPSTGTLSDGTRMPQRERNFGRGPDGRVNFGNYVLQLRYAPVAGDNGPPIVGSKPEDVVQAVSMSQASTGSSVLALADYLVFTTPPPTTTYTWQPATGPANA